MKHLLPLALLSAAICTATPAAAELSAKLLLDAFQAKGDKGTIKVYFRGLSEAFAWSNTALNNQGQTRLYCEPATITLTDEQELDIMRRYVESRPSFGTDPAGMVLLLSLKNAFPCP
jgi:hypothetical protein